ncbi:MULTISPECIES: hypothetical protein [Sporosarcina]|uniref:hypothetical protein n=1 Tax=Sporosarcina TaxID=1569 RepID=UPI003018197C
MFSEYRNNTGVSNDEILSLHTADAQQDCIEMTLQYIVDAKKDLRFVLDRTGTAVGLALYGSFLQNHGEQVMIKKVRYDDNYECN